MRKHDLYDETYEEAVRIPAADLVQFVATWEYERFPVVVVRPELQEMVEESIRDAEVNGTDHWPTLEEVEAEYAQEGEGERVRAGDARGADDHGAEDRPVRAQPPNAS